MTIVRAPLESRIQENMIAYMRLFAGLPGITVEDGETFWIVSHRSAPGNAILRARWGDGDTDARLDSLFAQISRHVDQIDWMVFPGDQPADLGQRLEARGMPGGPAGNWLWADLTRMPDAPPMGVPAELRIERVSDDTMMAEWVRVSEAGFEAELACFYDAYARHGYGSDAFSRHYIGYLGKTPVTSGTLLDAGGCAALYDISTPREYRGRGFGSAITHRMMQEMRERGYTESWIWSSNMARHVYQTLGYVDVDFGIREHVWKKEMTNIT